MNINLNKLFNMASEGMTSHALHLITNYINKLSVNKQWVAIIDDDNNIIVKCESESKDDQSLEGLSDRIDEVNDGINLQSEVEKYINSEQFKAELYYVLQNELNICQEIRIE